MPNRVVHFEIHADDPARAAKFYGGIFAWDIKEMDFGGTPYWVINSGTPAEPGINGGIVKRMGSRPEKGAPVSAFVCTLQVDSYDAYAKKAMDAGATEALPKFAIPGMAWQGYFIDTEGNIFGIHQPDVNAK